MAHTAAECEARPYYCPHCKTRFNDDETASRSWTPWALCPACLGPVGFRPDNDD